MSVILEQGCCPRRCWGKTELSIPVIPFGTQGFGDNFGPVTEAEALALIRRATDLGVNHFDCARCYGNSLAKLGAAIKQGVVKRDEIIISGRVCCHSAAPWGGYGQGDPDYSSQRILADIEDQLAILGIEQFDVLLIHDPLAIEPTLASGGTLAGLEEARERGWTRFIGYGMNPHAFHHAVISSGRTDAMLCFSDYNLLRQSAADTLLPAAAAADLGVLNGWSIMRGWLTGTPVESFIPRAQWGEDQQRAEAMRLWAVERNAELLPLTLRFCLREERIHGNPIGSLNIAQLENNVAAVLNAPNEVLLDELVAAGL